MGASTSLFGLWGLILVIFGVLAYAVAPGASAYVLLHIGLGLLLLILYFTTSRESLTTVLGERSAKYGMNAIVYSLAVIAVVLVVNWLAARHNVRWDLTAQNVYSLSTQSTGVLSKLEEPVEVHAFVEAGIDPLVQDLLGSYQYAGNDFTFHMVDPIKERDLTARFKITELPTLHIQHKDQTATVTGVITEETVTNGLLQATRTVKKLVCFLEGHGEPDLDDREANGAAHLQDALRNENYETRKVSLLSVEAVPEDCTILVVVGTERPFFDNELSAIEQSLKGGRAALFMVPPKRGAQLVELLVPWGVDISDSVVVDQVVRLFQGPALGLQILASTYGTHEITSEFRERTVFPLVRSVHAGAATKPGLHAVELVTSSASAWAESDMAGVFERGEASLSEGDIKGPVPLAVAVTANHKEMGPEVGITGEGETKLVVVGDADFANNQFLLQLFNRDFVLNTLNWLGGQEEMIAIRPRALRASSSQLTPDETRRVFFLSVLVIPELLLFLGLTVWWRRSNQ